MAEPRLCSVQGCCKPAYRRRQVCQGHFRRLQRDGDVAADVPLGCKPPKAPARAFLVECSLLETEECITWPFKRNSFGYASISENGSTRVASRVLCEIVHGLAPSPTHQAAHSCGGGRNGCVNPKHIRWATPVENHADRAVHGTKDDGEQSANAKLTDADVFMIRGSEGRVRGSDLARKLGVSQQSIHRVRKGKSWRHLLRDEVVA